MIPLIIFYIFTFAIISITLKSNFTKEKRIYVWTYFMYGNIIIHVYEYIYEYVYTCLYVFMYIYTYSCKKTFLPGKWLYMINNKSVILTQ